MPVDATNSEIVDELIAIKRLIVYTLRKEGASQEDLAKALGTSQSSVSRILAPGSPRSKSK